MVRTPQTLTRARAAAFDFDVVTDAPRKPVPKAEAEREPARPGAEPAKVPAAEA